MTTHHHAPHDQLDDSPHATYIAVCTAVPMCCELHGKNCEPQQTSNPWWPYERPQEITLAKQAHIAALRRRR